MRWIDYAPVHDTWEPYENFTADAQTLVEDFLKRYEEAKRKV